MCAPRPPHRGRARAVQPNVVVASLPLLLAVDEGGGDLHRTGSVDREMREALGLTAGALDGLRNRNKNTH